MRYRVGDRVSYTDRWEPGKTFWATFVGYLPNGMGFTQMVFQSHHEPGHVLVTLTDDQIVEEL